MFAPEGRPGKAALIAACEGALPVTMPLVVEEGPEFAVEPANSTDGWVRRILDPPLVGSASESVSQSRFLRSALSRRYHSKATIALPLSDSDVPRSEEICQSLPSPPASLMPPRAVTSTHRNAPRM